MSTELPIGTEITIEGSNLTLKTEYRPDILPNTIECFIGESDGIRTFYKKFTYGELMIETKNRLLVDFYINDNGDLIVISSSKDTDQYTIDEFGDLVYEII